MSLHALALVCTLKPSPAPSSSALIAEHVFGTLRDRGVECEALRGVDFDIAPGVQADMGDGDQWPQIRENIQAAGIPLISTPVWLGHPSSVTHRVLERLDAEMSTNDDEGRPRWRARWRSSVWSATRTAHTRRWPTSSRPSTTSAAARNAAHLAHVLKQSHYPPYYN